MGRRRQRIGRILVDATTWSEATVDARIAMLAGRQYGVVSTGQLRACGLGCNGIHHRSRVGRLHRVHQGVYAVGHATLSFEAQAMAAVLSCGGESVVCGKAAAVLHGISRFRCSRMEVLTTGRPRPRRGVTIRRTRQLPASDIVELSGIPVTSVARTIVDLADRLTVEQLRNLAYQSEYHHTWDESDVARVADRFRSRPGVHRVRAMLDPNRPGSAGTRSSPEDHALHLLPSTVPRPEVNASVPAGGHLIETDLFWRDIGLCVEVDGPGHQRRTARTTDAWKDALRTAAGYRVERITSDALVEGMERVVRIIAEMYASHERPAT